MTNTNNARELLPCPFCGGETKIHGLEDTGYFMHCLTEGCYGHNSAKHGEAATIAAWNRRVAPQPQGGALTGIAELVQVMLTSANCYIDGDDAVTGYRIKTGAIHRIIGQLACAGHPVSIPSNMPVANDAPSAAPPLLVCSETLRAAILRGDRHAMGLATGLASLAKAEDRKETAWDVRVRQGDRDA